MSEKVYDLFEFYQTNVGGRRIIDASKGLTERVYVEAINAETANEYMESLGVDFDEYCHCCGYRWYKASRPMTKDAGMDISIDVRYSKEPIAIHYIDGSMVVWQPVLYAPLKPESAEEALAIEEARIAKANEPRYNALPPEDEMREIAYAKAELLSAIDKNTARKAKAELLFAIREHMDGIYELMDKLSKLGCCRSWYNSEVDGAIRSVDYIPYNERETREFYELQKHFHAST